LERPLSILRIFTKHFYPIKCELSKSDIARSERRKINSGNRVYHQARADGFREALDKIAASNGSYDLGSLDDYADEIERGDA
jgi:hypothetical protein